MAKEKKENTAYLELKNACKQEDCRDIKRAYIFYGEERFLLEGFVGVLRKKLISDGLGEFNHKRLEGKSLKLRDIAEAVDSLPVFSERTLVEIHDFDMFKLGEQDKTELLSIIRDLPEYVCLIFIFDTIEYKPGGNSAFNRDIKKYVSVVEFDSMELQELYRRIERGFADAGKKIDRQAAEYLIFITGGRMTKIAAEIEKVAAYAKEKTVSKEDIDAVVIPVLDAATYKMTDAVIQGRYELAMSVLNDLLSMQEVPHKIIYSISMKLRQLTAARIFCVEEKKDMSEFMEICGITRDFQARNIIQCARKISLDWCRNALKSCADAAYLLNSSGRDGGEILSQFILELAMNKG